MTQSNKIKLVTVVAAGIVIFLVSPLILGKYEYTLDPPNSGCWLQQSINSTCYKKSKQTKTTTILKEWIGNGELQSSAISEYEPVWIFNPWLSVLLPLAISTLAATGLYFLWIKKPKQPRHKA